MGVEKPRNCVEGLLGIRGALGVLAGAGLDDVLGPGPGASTLPDDVPTDARIAEVGDEAPLSQAISIPRAQSVSSLSGTDVRQYTPQDYFAQRQGAGI